jgi:tRNA(fMet)-specific endonuclease VapC
MASVSGYLLDTNVLLELLRGKALGQRIDKQFNLRSVISTCVISVVTVGEMESLVRQFKWGTRKLSDLKLLLDELPWVDINDPSILDAYGQIDHYSNQVGRSMGKNDVWIAATAHVTTMTLLTTDQDFDHLEEQFLSRTWIDPKDTSAT